MQHAFLTLTAIVLLTACGALKKKDDSDSRSCQVPQNTNVPVRNDRNEGDDGDDGIFDKSTDAKDDLPINRSGLWIGAPAPASDVVSQPAPVQTTPSLDVPFPIDECTMPVGGVKPTDIVVHDPSDPKYPTHGSDACSTSMALDRADPKREPSSGSGSGNACASDVTLTKNIPAAGHSATLNLDWQVAQGALVYEEAKVACRALGDDWHLAETAELDLLIAQPEFRAPTETSCDTTFWAAGAYNKSTQCVAPYRGLQSIKANDAASLPINAKAKIRNLSGISSVADRRVGLCVKGSIKPAVACLESVNLFFQNRPLGARDPKTGLTWAKITVKSFTNAKDVATQCALGAGQGWRMPTKAELEVVVKNDLFKTAVYKGADASCPMVWHAPVDVITTGGIGNPIVTQSDVSCGQTGVDVAGNVLFATDAGCVAARTNGLCVQDKQP